MADTLTTARPQFRLYLYVFEELTRNAITDAERAAHSI